MRRLLFAGLLAVYLTIGVSFALATQPEQTWVCPDAGSPHGEITYGGYASAPRDNCRATVTFGDRAQWVATATPLWLLLVVGQAASPD